MQSYPIMWYELLIQSVTLKTVSRVSWTFEYDLYFYFEYNLNSDVVSGKERIKEMYLVYFGSLDGERLSLVGVYELSLVEVKRKWSSPWVRSIPYISCMLSRRREI